MSSSKVPPVTKISIRVDRVWPIRCIRCPSATQASKTYLDSLGLNIQVPHRREQYHPIRTNKVTIHQLGPSTTTHSPRAPSLRSSKMTFISGDSNSRNALLLHALLLSTLDPLCPAKQLSLAASTRDAHSLISKRYSTSWTWTSS